MDQVSISSWVNSYMQGKSIAPLFFGMTQEELRTHLGEPDDVGGSGKRISVLKYSTIEFHFVRNNGGLALIYSEDPPGSTPWLSLKETV